VDAKQERILSVPRETERPDGEHGLFDLRLAGLGRSGAFRTASRNNGRAGEGLYDGSAIHWG
jgi:hypothetical protein